MPTLGTPHGQISDWRKIDGLRTASSLTYLTLFHNPICKNGAYRSYVVNCCRSLRGLDLHAVSDDEVIEGVHLPASSRFKGCTPVFAIPPCLLEGLANVTRDFSPASNTTMRKCSGSCETHLESRWDRSSQEGVARRVARRIQILRRLQSGLSPVIICQRRTRRFLSARKNIEAVLKLQAWARMRSLHIKARKQLKDLLKTTGELYLVQVKE